MRYRHRHDVAQEPKFRRGAKGEEGMVGGRAHPGAGTVDLNGCDNVADDVAVTGIEADGRRRAAARNAVRQAAEVNAARCDRGKSLRVELGPRLKQDREGVLGRGLRSRGDLCAVI